MVSFHLALTAGIGLTIRAVNATGLDNFTSRHLCLDFWETWESLKRFYVFQN